MLFGGLFSGLVDQRTAKGRRYALEPLLCGLLLAVLSGATSLRKMELFINERIEPLNALFGMTWKKAPSWVGIRRFLLKLDVQGLENALRQHAEKCSASGEERQFVAIDGKVLRGSASRVTDTRARQLVSAFAHFDLIVLGHVEVADKTNEIPAAQALIDELALSGRVFTLDAMHCQKNAFAGSDARCRYSGSGERQPTRVVCNLPDAAEVSGSRTTAC